MSSANAVAVLSEFGQQLGIPNLSFAEDGYCSMGFDEFIVNMELTEAGETLAFSIWLEAIPEERRSAVALRIADANYLFYGTQGATLGMNRDTGDVVLAIQIATATLSLQRFGKLVENLVNIAEALKKRLLTDEAAVSHSAVPPDFAIGIRI